MPPYQVLVATNVAAPAWDNFGPATTNTSLTLQPGTAPAFYRIAGH